MPIMQTLVLQKNMWFLGRVQVCVSAQKTCDLARTAQHLFIYICLHLEHCCEEQE